VCYTRFCVVSSGRLDEEYFGTSEFLEGSKGIQRCRLNAAVDCRPVNTLLTSRGGGGGGGCATRRLSAPVTLLANTHKQINPTQEDTYMMFLLTKLTPIMNAQLGILEKPQIA
jgi:hypothetical protein